MAPPTQDQVPRSFYVANLPPIEPEHEQVHGPDQGQMPKIESVGPEKHPEQSSHLCQLCSIRTLKTNMKLLVI